MDVGVEEVVVCWRSLAHMLHRPVLVLHGPASTATVAQPFLYPGQPTGGMIGKEMARRESRCSATVCGF